MRAVELLHQISSDVNLFIPAGIEFSSFQINHEQRLKMIEMFLKLRQSNRSIFLKCVEKFEAADNAAQRLDLYEAMLGILSTVDDDCVVVPIKAVEEADDRGLKKYRSLIGRRVAKLRTSLGWTQLMVAEKTGIQQSHISRIEAGKVSPSYLTVQRLASVFGVPPAQIDPNYPDA